MAAVLKPETLRALNQLRTDFVLYAGKALRVRGKSGQIQPLKLNRAQKHIHERIEAQRQETGKVRALILKGRQQGCSTYVEGRFFWRTVWEQGIRTFILTHEESASANRGASTGHTDSGGTCRESRYTRREKHSISSETKPRPARCGGS